AAGAEEHDVPDALGQRLEGRLDVEAIVLGEILDQLEIERIAPVPALDRARGEAERRERDDPLRVEERDDAESVALRARAQRIVEREQPRLELGERMVADRAREAARE